MRISDHFHTKPYADPDDEEPYRCELYTRSGKTGLILDGVDLVGQFQLDGAHLLFLEHNCPYEEALDIYLVSDQLKILDHRGVSVAYASDSFKLLSVTGLHSVLFEFMSTWSLEVLERPHYMWPAFTDFHWVPLPWPLDWPYLLRRRYLKLRRQPGELVAQPPPTIGQ